MHNVQSVFGIFALLALAWLISENRRAVSLRHAAVGLVATVVVAVACLKIPQIEIGFAAATDAVRAIAAATRAGTSFLFGYLGGGTLPFELKPKASAYVFAFETLPIVLVMSVLTTLLFYWRIMPPVVRGFSWALERTMGVGGAVGVSTAANIFVGMVEAPLFIRPYLASLSRSELFIVMTGGMAGVAGTVFAVYATILGPIIPDAAGHIVVASVLGAPAAILIGQIMIPDPKGQQTLGDLDVSSSAMAESTMDAIVKATGAGLELMLNIAAMLVVFLALVYLVDGAFGLLPAIGGEPMSLERLLGWIMAPVCWLMGIPWDEAPTAGSLMGVKTILNEFIAYLKLAALPDGALSPRSRLIMLYAMCGFANFGSAGIMIAGMATMAPGRRAEIAALGLKSIVSGTLCTCLLGAIVGALT
ncbi:MAG: nucleoside:proton symporter [Alphaproteobacteria bacterium]|nr:nucleoside:proton symporter [Alphaproteobacteria bacterium]